MHYRILTGACDAGVRQFMEQNKLPFKVVNNKTVEVKPIAAKELLPILERNNAYGLNKFKELLNFCKFFFSFPSPTITSWKLLNVFISIFK